MYVDGEEEEGKGRTERYRRETRNEEQHPIAQNNWRVSELIQLVDRYRADKEGALRAQVKLEEESCASSPKPKPTTSTAITVHNVRWIGPVSNESGPKARSLWTRKPIRRVSCILIICVRQTPA
jgi:hypothetical protein